MNDLLTQFETFFTDLLKVDVECETDAHFNGLSVFGAQFDVERVRGAMVHAGFRVVASVHDDGEMIEVYA